MLNLFKKLKMTGNTSVKTCVFVCVCLCVRVRESNSAGFVMEQKTK